MRRPGIPMFLQRRPYRRRRRIDAARLLPVFGAFLLLLPILWEPVGGGDRRVVRDGLYLFGVWAGLVAIALVLVPGLTAPEPAPDLRRGLGDGDAGAADRDADRGAVGPGVSAGNGATTGDGG